MFTYKCTDCSLVFEKLVPTADRDSVTCACSAPAAREGVELMNTKSSINPAYKVIHSRKEADLVVGADADARWAAHDKRFTERTKDMVEIDTGITAGSSFNPERIIGSEKNQQVAELYETAVKNGDPAVSDNWVDKIDPKALGMQKLS